MDFGTGSIVNNIGNAIDSGGNICRAVLCVRDPKTFKVDTDAASEKLHKEIMQAAKDRLQDNGSSSFSNIGYPEISRMAKNNGYLALGVKYNPETIHFESDAGGKSKEARQGVGGVGDTLMYQTMTRTQISMSCTLVFEEINIYDAFINNFESVSLNPGALTSLGASTAKKFLNAKKKEELGDMMNPYDEPYSIRRYLEGFMSLLLHECTRDVIFYWGKSCFHGILTSVTSNYKMFNKVGAPILGEINIRITQYNSQGKSDKSASDVQWEEAYKKVFGEDGWDASTSTSAGADKLFDNLGKIGIL